MTGKFHELLHLCKYHERIPTCSHAVPFRMAEVMLSPCLPGNMRRGRVHLTPSHTRTEARCPLQHHFSLLPLSSPPFHHAGATAATMEPPAVSSDCKSRSELVGRAGQGEGVWKRMRKCCRNLSHSKPLLPHPFSPTFHPGWLHEVGGRWREGGRRDREEPRD